MSTANTQRPSGVLQTVSFFMGGGGGVCYGETTPEVTYGAPSYELLPYSQETYISDEVTFGTCGWNDSSPLAAYLFFEDTQLTFGDTIEVSQVPTGEFMAVHFVDLPENPQAGNYSVLLGDADEALTIEFSLVWPTEPRMYRLADGSVMLWNFQPNERVTLFAYDELQNQPEREGQFVGYQTYQTDSDGWLYVEVNQLVDAFGVVGEDTGQISESFTHFMIASPIME